jgi:hypothetical protein
MNESIHEYIEEERTALRAAAFDRPPRLKPYILIAIIRSASRVDSSKQASQAKETPQRHVGKRRLLLRTNSVQGTCVSSQRVPFAIRTVPTHSQNLRSKTFTERACGRNTVQGTQGIFPQFAVQEWRSPWYIDRPPPPLLAPLALQQKRTVGNEMQSLRSEASHRCPPFAGVGSTLLCVFVCVCVGEKAGNASLALMVPPMSNHPLLAAYRACLS